MSPPSQLTVRNHLLRALPPDTFARLAPHLEPILSPLNKILITPDRPIAHAYFVEDGIVSILANGGEGRIEVGLVGREGLAGVPLVLGVDRTPHVALVQAELTALRIAAPAFHTALAADPALGRVLKRYVQCLMVQVAETVRASTGLTVDGRLARWILMTHDRVEGDDSLLTHEFLSAMLDVRRPGVTAAIHLLEGAKLIRATRGRITVLDRAKLEETVGDAYGVAEAEYARLIPET